MSIAEKCPQSDQEDNAADDSSSDAGKEDGAGGDVEGGPRLGLGCFVQSTKQRFDGTVEQLRDQDQADAADKNAPFERIAAQYNGRGRPASCRERQRGTWHARTGAGAAMGLRRPGSVIPRADFPFACYP